MYKSFRLTPFQVIFAEKVVLINFKCLKRTLSVIQTDLGKMRDQEEDKSTSVETSP